MPQDTSKLLLVAGLATIVIAIFSGLVGYHYASGPAENLEQKRSSCDAGKTNVNAEVASLREELKTLTAEKNKCQSKVAHGEHYTSPTVSSIIASYNEYIQETPSTLDITETAAFSYDDFGLTFDYPMVLGSLQASTTPAFTEEANDGPYERAIFMTLDDNPVKSIVYATDGNEPHGRGGFYGDTARLLMQYDSLESLCDAFLHPDRLFPAASCEVMQNPTGLDYIKLVQVEKDFGPPRPLTVHYLFENDASDYRYSIISSDRLDDLSITDAMAALDVIMNSLR